MRSRAWIFIALLLLFQSGGCTRPAPCAGCWIFVRVVVELPFGHSVCPLAHIASTSCAEWEIERVNHPAIVAKQFGKSNGVVFVVAHVQRFCDDATDAATSSHQPLRLGFANARTTTRIETPKCATRHFPFPVRACAAMNRQFAATSILRSARRLLKPDISDTSSTQRHTTGTTGVSPVDTHNWDNGRPAR